MPTHIVKNTGFQTGFLPDPGLSAVDFCRSETKG
jgi:hypothetical protein